MISFIKKTINQTFNFSISSKEETFELLEKRKSAKCKKAKFRRNTENPVIAYKFDEPKEKIMEKFPFFNDGNYKAMCDYILFYYKNHTCYIILCNLKSDNLHNNTDQFNAGNYFSNFIISTTKRCHPETNNIPIKLIKVLFSSKINRYGNNKPSNKPNSQNGIIPYLSNDKYCHICNLDAICN
ncbi:MAG: hypothetical protein A2033_14640 [Bacteroidetes bacterium GWA2_31_9]|nr:MAG: hypothetical protein A2033_14640 [Bacteroidetes bacterium GWA2_31_9]